MYYSILNNELLFKVVNNHPLFSYALTTIRDFTDNYCVYVDSRLSIDIVKKYHENVKTLDNDKIDFNVKELPLHKPLLNSKHLNGKIDKLFHYEINDELDCISIESLIKSNFCESTLNKRVTIILNKLL